VKIILKINRAIRCAANVINPEFLLIIDWIVNKIASLEKLLSHLKLTIIENIGPFLSINQSRLN